MSDLGPSPGERKTTRFDAAAVPRSDHSEVRGPQGHGQTSPHRDAGQADEFARLAGADPEIRDVSLESLLDQVEAALAAIRLLDELETDQNP